MLKSHFKKVNGYCSQCLLKEQTVLGLNQPKGKNIKRMSNGLNRRLQIEPLPEQTAKVYRSVLHTVQHIIALYYS